MMNQLWENKEPMPQNLPFDPIAISESHSALTGVLAGFALAAIFLLIERANDAKNDQKQQYLRAMLLLFVAFITGTLSSYLYSSITGDPPIRGFHLFKFASAVFVICAIVLLVGINSVFSAIGIENVLTLARRITYFIVIFAVLVILGDSVITVRVFGLPTSVTTWLYLFALIPLVISLLILASRRKGIRQYFKDNLFSAFCYAATLNALVLAFLHNIDSSIEESNIESPIWVILFTIGSVSILGAWAMLLSPHKAATTN
jgi:hypothetical protein